MEITLDTSDLGVLQDFYGECSTIDQRKIFLAAYRKAAQPILQKVKAAAPVGKTRKVDGVLRTGGGLRRSMGISAVPDEIAIEIGASNRRAGWMAHFVESGTKERFRKTKQGKVSTGRVTGTHYFENAIEGEGEKAMNAAAEGYFEAIDKAIVKYNRKNKK
jgi:hypothetical protein